MHLRLFFGCGFQLRLSIRLEEISSSLSLLSFLNKELPSDYSRVCLPPGQLIQISCVPPVPKGKCHLFDLIPGGFFPSNKSIQGEVPLWLSFVLLMALGPRWKQKAFPGLRARKKQNGSGFYQAVDSRNIPV